MPARNSSENDTNFIHRIDIYRLADPISAPEQINEEEFSTRSTLIDSIPVGDDDFSLKTFSYTDTLAFSNQPARLRYAIRFVNKSGQKAAFSNFLTIEPTAKIASNPENLDYDLTQDSLTLRWEKPDTNIDGSTPANVLGYNIYRKSSIESQAKKINSAPVSDTQYPDNFFEFETEYTYYVRAISIGSEGEPVESLNSEELKVTPKDIFPPGSPESITVAAAPNAISIFFAANPDKDILGYRVFRSTDNTLPLEQWELLTPEPIKTNTFQDQNIKSGVKYFYYIIALDKYGNTGKPSQIVSETVP